MPTDGPMNAVALREHDLMAGGGPEEELQGGFRLSGLAGHIQEAFTRNKTAKERIDRIILDCKRRIEGEYDSGKLSDIRAAGGSEVFMMVTSQKTRDAKAWIKDILGREKSWDLVPTPIPDLPDDVGEEISMEAIKSRLIESLEMGKFADDMADVEGMIADMQADAGQIASMVRDRAKEIALEEAKKIELKIDDILAEGDWAKELSAVTSDIIDYPAGILKGPVEVFSTELAYRNGKPEMVPKTVKKFLRVHPLDFFPAPDMRNTHDGGDIIQRHRLSYKDLYDLKGVDGFSEEAIDAVLETFGSADGWMDDYDSEREELEHKASTSEVHRATALEFHGAVSGKVLIAAGLDEGEVSDPLGIYYITAWMVGGRVIKLIKDIDQSGRSIWYSTSFDWNPDSIWGKGVPQLMLDMQDLMNQQVRALDNNTAMASGPCVSIDMDRMDADIDGVHPWLVFRTVRSHLATTDPVRFHNIPFVADKLLNNYKFLKAEADNVTGIPAFSHGDPQVGGAGNTASGLSMLMSAAARGIKQVVSNINRDIQAPALKMLHFVIKSEDESGMYRGDAQVVIKGIEGIIAKEQKVVRLNELLNLTNNQVDLGIIGMNGRKELLKAVFDSLEVIDLKKVFPDTATGATLAGAPSLDNAAQSGQELDLGGNKPSGQDFELFKNKEGIGTANASLQA